MRILEAITEAEMIAVFLKGEIQSVRFGPEILALLRRDGMDRRVVDAPDSGDPAENAYRMRLLGDFRGYGQHRELFDTFPEEVAWFRAALSREELARVRYIDYSYWNELSGGSRLPADAAQNIAEGIEVFGQSTRGFLEDARALREIATLPELILIGVERGSPLVVVEGHVRLTLYFLAPERIPEELTVLVGYSPNAATWMAL